MKGYSPETLRIAEINGMDPAKVDPDEVRELYFRHGLNGRSSKRLDQKYIDQNAHGWFPGPTDKRRFAENIHTFSLAAEALLDLDMGYHSYGKFYPTYHFFLEQQRQEGYRPNYRSLLIGSLSPQTTSEYEQTVRQTFSNAKTYTVDIKGVTTATPPNFIFGDGMHLPFMTGSLDSVHTNVLLHFLGENSTSRKRLYGEILRVLKPNGSLMMAESNFEDVFGTEKNVEGIFGKELSQAVFNIEGKNSGFNFRDIKVIPGLRLQRREQAYHLSQASQHWIDPDSLRSRSSLGISAKKG